MRCKSIRLQWGPWTFFDASHSSLWLGRIWSNFSRCSSASTNPPNITCSRFAQIKMIMKVPFHHTVICLTEAVFTTVLDNKFIGHGGVHLIIKMSLIPSYAYEDSCWHDLLRTHSVALTVFISKNLERKNRNQLENSSYNHAQHAFHLIVHAEFSFVGRTRQTMYWSILEVLDSFALGMMLYTLMNIVDFLLMMNSKLWQAAEKPKKSENIVKEVRWWSFIMCILYCVSEHLSCWPRSGLLPHVSSSIW